MRLLFKDIGSTISVKSCYSRMLSSVALAFLVLLLSVVLLVGPQVDDVSVAKMGYLSIYEKILLRP